MSDEKVPAGFTEVDDDSRPGEPLYPGENTIVDRGNHPLKEGSSIEVYAEGRGESQIKATLQVIDRDEGDIIAIPDDESPINASQMYRVDADMGMIHAGAVYGVPKYDSDDGVLTIRREVKQQGRYGQHIVEVRSIGGRADWELGDAGL